MNKNICFLFFIIIAHWAFGQQPSRVTIKGVVKDKDNVEAPFATVMLLNPRFHLAEFYAEQRQGGIHVCECAQYGLSAEGVAYQLFAFADDDSAERRCGE